MKIDIIIPSLARYEKLHRCLISIKKAIEYKQVNDIKVFLYFSRHEDMTEFNLSPPAWLYCDLIQDYKFAHSTVFNYHIKDSKADAILYASDDIEFHEDCLDKVANCMTENYPDMDGLIGINQINIDPDIAVKYAFGLIGAKYAKRFPSKQVVCPDYITYYTDWSIGACAIYLNRFKFCKEAKLIHHHPFVDEKNIDDTYRKGQEIRGIDAKTHKERQDLGLLWGKDFTLIRKESQK